MPIIDIPAQKFNTDLTIIQIGNNLYIEKNQAFLFYVKMLKGLFDNGTIVAAPGQEDYLNDFINQPIEDVELSAVEVIMRS